MPDPVHALAASPLPRAPVAPQQQGVWHYKQWPIPACGVICIPPANFRPMGSLRHSLARVIRERRSALNVSQERFAANVGLHRTQMGNLEQGKTNPTLDTLELVAGGLNLTLSELLALAEAADPPAGHLRRIAEPRRRR